MIREFKNRVVEGIKDFLEQSVFFVKWLLLATGMGILTGTLGAGFYYCLSGATVFRQEHPFLILGLPLGGLFIVWLYRVMGREHDKGTNTVVASIQESTDIPFKMAPLIFISTTITQLVGGSAGREGAALQLGGATASLLSKLFKLENQDRKILIMSGMSAVFAGLFGTPLTSVVFAMEVITVGVMHYSAIVPCTIAALVASGMSQAMGIAPTAFTIANIPETIMFETGALTIVLGIASALISILFCIAMEHTSHAYKKHIKNPMIRVFAGGCIVIALTYLVGCRDYNGAGMDIIIQALNGDAKAEAFLLKIVFTALTLGAGYKGGEIVPSFFIGATFGCVAGPLLGLPADFAASLCMAAVFCGVTNCPLASIILCIELFGFQGTGYYALCCGISYMLSGYYGLYSEQKIMYSKVQPEFINKNVH